MMFGTPKRPTEEPLHDLAHAYIQAGQALHLAILDDAAARLRTLAPDAETLALGFGDDGDATVHGVWGAPARQLDGQRNTLLTPETIAPHDARTLAEVAADLEQILPSVYLEAWGLEQASDSCPEHEVCSTLHLPPKDRLATVANLVRAYIPDAVGLVCPIERREHRVLVGFEHVLRTDGEPVSVPCPACQPVAKKPWPRFVSFELTRHLSQMYALPHLRSRHMTPCLDTASEHGTPLWQITLPARPNSLSAATTTVR